MIFRLALMSIAVALAACSNSQGSSPVPLDGSGTHVALQQASHQRNAATEAVIYNFGSKSPDGKAPWQTLTDVRGTLYGETDENTSHPRGDRHGTIFTVTPSGSETVLHLLTKAQGQALSQVTLGPRPGGGLSLYGTGEGGYYISGTVVRVTLSGAVIVLHSFGVGADGAEPEGGLINVNGTFYGTTLLGGGSGCSNLTCGTVFSVTPSGSETVIYAFRGGPQDGNDPKAGLVDLNGTFYGTTYGGGTYHQGTVFSVTTSGSEHVLHSFQGGHDGALPKAGLIAVNGKLYGTTDAGGGTGCSVSRYYTGCGTVFSITPSGTEAVLHSFTGADGARPEATLLALNGKMYGTTENGGTGGSGTVFSITPSGTEKVLHDFTGGSDGAAPGASGLINIRRTLYGTTLLGGTYDDGTVYSITL